MNRRVKRRLWLLGILLVVCTGMVSAWMGFAAWNRQRRIDTAVTEGIAAHERGEHELALRLLSYAAEHRRKDPELLLAYAGSRLRNPDPSGDRRHLASAINQYEAVLELDPGNQPALKALFDAYLSTNRPAEALEIAGRLLEPDAEVLIRLARLEQSSGRPRRALEAIDRLRELDPDDERWVMLEYELRMGMGESPEAVLEAIEKHGSTEEVDLARILLLQGMGRKLEARVLASRMSEQENLTPERLVDLRSRLEHLGLQGRRERIESVIREAAMKDSEVAHELVGLQWRAGDVAGALDTADAAAGRFPEDGRFLRAATLLRAILAATLPAAVDDGLLVMDPEEPEDPRTPLDEAIARLDRSIRSGTPVHPREGLLELRGIEGADVDGELADYLLVLEGLLLEEVGRDARAIEAYQRAFKRSGAKLAGMLLARAYLDERQFGSAIDTTALLAVKHPSIDVSVLECLVLVELARTGRNASAADRRMDQGDSLFENIKARYLGWRDAGVDASVLLPLVAEAAFIESDEEGLRFAREEVVSSDSIDHEDVLRIIELPELGDDRDDGALIEHLRRRGGTDSEADMIQARRSNDARARQLVIDSMLDAARGLPEGSPERRAAFRRIMDHYGREGGSWESRLQLIRSIHDELADDLDSARMVLRIPGVWTHAPDLAEASLEVVGDRLGEDSPLHVLARAGRALGGEDLSPRSKAEAIVSVGDIVEAGNASLPGALAMSALLRAGEDPDPLQAISYLRRVLDLRPGLVELYPTLIDLLQKTGHGGLALEYLERYRELLVEDGPGDRRVKDRGVPDVHEQFISPGTSTVDHLYRTGLLERRERFEEALAGYDEVLQQDPGNVLARLGKARLLAKLGRMEEAYSTINEDDGLTEEERIRYRILIHPPGGDPGEAPRWDRRLSESAPEDPRSWMALYRSLPDPPGTLERIELLERVLKLDPGNVDASRELVDESMAAGDLRTTSRAIESLRAALPESASIQQLRIDATDRRTGALAPESGHVRRSGELTRQLPASLEAARLSWQLHRSVGDHPGALDIAMTAMDQRPSAVEPCLWAMESALSSGAWEEAIELAKRAGGRMTPSERSMQEVRTAELCVALGDGPAGMEFMERYLPVIDDRDRILGEAGNPVLLPADFPEQARLATLKCLIASGRAKEALERFGPLIEEGPGLKDSWIETSLGLGNDEAREAMRLIDSSLQSSQEDLMRRADALLRIAERTGRTEDLEAADRAIELWSSGAPNRDPVDLREARLLTLRGEDQAARLILSNVLERFRATPAGSSTPDQLEDFLTASDELAFAYAEGLAGERTMALEIIDEALESAPPGARGALLETRSLIEFRGGECLAAERSIRSAIDVDPGNLDHRLRLVEILEGCGRSDEAGRERASARESLLLAPDRGGVRISAVAELIESMKGQSTTRSNPDNG
ncbi:MAG: tetratricopeptide repeat protein [Planctomycetota bacterium]|nr:tetratricopeptide repeat protein [Planctomycetota bacterium]